MMRKSAMVVAVALLSVVAVFVVAATQPVGAADQRYDSFPLFKDVPGRDFATVGSGVLANGTRWGAYVSRVGVRKASAKRPCISVASITSYGEYAYAHRCGLLAPRDSSEVIFTSVVSTFTTRNGAVAGESILGLTVDPTVRKVELAFDSDERIERPTTRVNVRQLQKTDLVPFRVLAVALSEARCVEGITGYNRMGKIVVESTTLPCPD